MPRWREPRLQLFLAVPVRPVAVRDLPRQNNFRVRTVPPGIDIMVCLLLMQEKKTSFHRGRCTAATAAAPSDAQYRRSIGVHAHVSTSQSPRMHLVSSNASATLHPACGITYESPRARTNAHTSVSVTWRAEVHVPCCIVCCFLQGVHIFFLP